MTYKKEANDFEKALSLDSDQVVRIKIAIEKAYDQAWHKDGPNIDQINNAVAQHIHTPEEAFYAATVIVSDVVGALGGLDKLKK
jgi:hypothetical protein